MNPKNQLMRDTIKLLLYHPEKINKVKRVAGKDAKTICRLLKILIPYRTGIEIDCAGGNTTTKAELEEMKSKHKQRRMFDINLDFYNESSLLMTQANEIRLSPYNMKGLSLLKEILDHLDKSDKIALAKEGGLHLHNDLGITVKEAREKRVAERLKPYFLLLRSAIFKYPHKLGNYGEEIVDYNTRCKININDIGTIEYRMGSVTFNYTQIMKWNLCCQHITRSIRRGTKVNKQLIYTILDA